MASETARIRPRIRRLWTSDQPGLALHFQRLDPPMRRLRFGAAVSDEFLASYSRQLSSIDSVIFGAFPDGAMRGVGELRGLLDSWPPTAEIALSVEPAWQDGGIGDALLNRLIATARNRGIRTLHMMCLRENMRMQSLARKHCATLQIDAGSAQATLDPPWPTPMSMFEEIFGGPGHYLHGIFDPPD